MSRKQLAVLLVCVTLAVAVYFFSSGQPRELPSAAGAGSGYVDSAACAACHQDIAETYRLTGMGRSFYTPRAENAIENFTTGNTFHHRASDRYYTMFERDGKFYQRRHQIGYDGKETNVVDGHRSVRDGAEPPAGTLRSPSGPGPRRPVNQPGRYGLARG